MPSITVNGATLYYEEQGTGAETVVFGHSLLFNLRMFDKQVAAFKDRYRCVTFDFRGQGKSEVTADGYDMDTLTEDAAALIEKLEAAPCHFVGFSMGGFVGLRLALHYPDYLQSLTLINSSADAQPRESLLKYKLLTGVARWLGPGMVVSQVMPIMFGSKFLKDQGRASQRATWEQHLRANDPKGVARAVQGVIKRIGVSDEIDRIQMPTLIVASEQDIALPPAYSERMGTSIPNAQMVTIPDAGHMSPVEEPGAINAALDRFLHSLKQETPGTSDGRH